MEDKLILKITIYSIGITWVKYILIPLHHEIGDLELLEWHVNLKKIVGSNTCFVSSIFRNPYTKILMLVCQKVNTQYRINTNMNLFSSHLFSYLCPNIYKTTSYQVFHQGGTKYQLN
jgi:hypothetical protein